MCKKIAWDRYVPKEQLGSSDKTCKNIYTMNLKLVAIEIETLNNQ